MIGFGELYERSLKNVQEKSLREKHFFCAFP